MRVWSDLKFLVRPWKQLLEAVIDTAYDYYRFTRYGGWRRNYYNVHLRSYRAIKLYHSLEKSLSHRHRRPGAGWAVARDLMGLLRFSELDKDRDYQEEVAREVLLKFIEAAQPAEAESALRPRELEWLRSIRHKREELGGAARIRGAPELPGWPASAADFFGSRRSIRDFSSRSVDRSLIARAVEFASRSPSACNRQPWHVYHWDDSHEIERILKIQKGIRGAEKDVPALLIVTSDLSAYDSAGERNQHWIDGGMFAMSLVWALHSLGLSTCCLNWSRGGAEDVKLRRKVCLKDSHSVVMMIATGYGNQETLVCASERRLVQHLLTHVPTGNSKHD